jgi:hypothetical protein
MSYPEIDGTFLINIHHIQIRLIFQSSVILLLPYNCYINIFADRERSIIQVRILTEEKLCGNKQ